MGRPGSSSKSVSFFHYFRVCLVSCQYTVNGNVFSTNLPNNLAPGEYLVRHEIIALHLATTEGKAEFYPSCQQIKVGGSETGVPSDDELLSFPGAYSDTDPGIYTPNVRDSDEPIGSSSDLRVVSRSSTPAPHMSSLADPSLHSSHPAAAAAAATVRAQTTVRAQAFPRRALASRSRRLLRTHCHTLSPQALETLQQVVPTIVH